MTAVTKHNLSGYRYGCRCDICRAASRDAARARRAKGLRPEDRRHGTLSGYEAGCGCQACAEAKLEYTRQWWARRRAAEPVPEHGTTLAHARLGCRCVECVAAYRASRGISPREPLTEVVHGTEYAYVRKGCRCDECRAAIADVQRRRRAARAAS